MVESDEKISQLQPDCDRQVPNAKGHQHRALEAGAYEYGSR
jgi:hypothetical protein